LEDANLTGAILVNADLSDAELDAADFYKARYTVDTIWPDDFDPKAAWAILVDN